MYFLDWIVSPHPVPSCVAAYRWKNSRNTMNICQIGEIYLEELGFAFLVQM